MKSKEDRRKDILRRCMREAGYSVRPEMAMTEGGTPVTEARVLTFDFIEDDRFGGSKRALMEKDRRLKKLVNVVREGNIRTLHFSGVDGPSLQWRKTYWVARSGTETWEDVMEKINSIQAPPYKFERIGLPRGNLAGELEGVGTVYEYKGYTIKIEKDKVLNLQTLFEGKEELKYFYVIPKISRSRIGFFDTEAEALQAAKLSIDSLVRKLGGVGTALSPMHSPARGVSRAEREKLLKIIGSISETLVDEAWGVLHDDYIRLSQAVSDLALENKLGPRRREKITLALNHFADAYHGHFIPPFRPDKAEMTEALAVVKKQVQGLS